MGIDSDENTTQRDGAMQYSPRSAPPPATAPTERFTSRVADYTRHRPGYPDEVVDLIESATGLGPGSTVADIGAGTGISAELFIRRGYTVIAVEPNAAMRAEAERRLGGEPGFRSVGGSAEATGLPGESVDLVVAAQAFHWFEPVATRREFARILRPGGWLAILWNERRADTPFLAGYEALLRRYSTDYATVDHRNVGIDRLIEIFGVRPESRTLPNRQVFDYPALRGRLLSSSYAPAPGQPLHDEMIAALRELYDEHQRDGLVSFEYDLHLHLGRGSRGAISGEPEEPGSKP